MKEIKLTKGYKTVVDDDLFDYLNQFSWSITGGGYAQTKLKGIKNPILMHRLIFALSREEQIDHINLNKLDNRLDNLRICSLKDNMRNRRINKNNKTGFKGVYYNKNRKHYEANITFNLKHKYIGCYSTAKEAAVAYNIVAKKYYGEFAWLNKI